MIGVLKLLLDDLVVPTELKGFIKGRIMDGHLASVQALWKSDAQGAWLRIDLSKAFDSTSHELMGMFLTEIRVPVPWVSALEQFLQGPIRFLVGNQLTLWEIP